MEKTIILNKFFDNFLHDLFALKKKYIRFHSESLNSFPNKGHFSFIQCPNIVAGSSLALFYMLFVTK